MREFLRARQPGVSPATTVLKTREIPEDDEEDEEDDEDEGDEDNDDGDDGYSEYPNAAGQWFDIIDGSGF